MVLRESRRPGILGTRMKHPTPSPAYSPPEHYSYSSISTWYQCRSRWLRRYMLGEPDPSGFEAQVGGFVHGVLEHVVRPDVPHFDRGLESLRTVASSMWAEGEWRNDIPSEDVPRFKLAVWEKLRAWGRIEPEPVFVVANELELRTDLSIEGSRIPFLGYVDRVDSNSRGTTIVDYKSGRRPIGAVSERESFRQLMIYAAAMRYLDLGYPPPTVAKLIYLGGQPDVLTTEVTTRAINAALDWFREGWAEILGLVENHPEAVERSAETMTTPTKLCGWCSYEQSCPAGWGRPRNLRSRQHIGDTL